jgi:hypothetical protein
MKKICCSCKIEKDLKEFSFKNKKKEVYSRECKVCHNIYNKKWYKKHTQERIDYARERTVELSQKLKKYKRDLKCKNCNESHISTLDFHHRDSKEKDFSISEMIRKGYSWERILKEIEKCDVLCSNCHRKLHYIENNIVE